MSVILTRLVHRDCTLGVVSGCTTLEAVELGIKTDHGIQITSRIQDTIADAAKTHVLTAHKGQDVNLRLLTAFIIWKDGGKGINLLAISKDRASKQIQLALDRGCVDHLHVEFTAKIISPNEKIDQSVSHNNEATFTTMQLKKVFSREV
ncbi:hypothetical protein ONZ43_g5817 [Nemania bipapillata]|uniref:Uncharacterized protein n=1 Tax=Nemania bipapillata TaxID=110536 RepID=A0ACC2I608_9PEZI|nr:hypothetical protein ONZ43_g5817 [Nemania bipapillata]